MDIVGDTTYLYRRGVVIRRLGTGHGLKPPPNVPENLSLSRPKGKIEIRDGRTRPSSRVRGSSDPELDTMLQNF